MSVVLVGILNLTPDSFSDGGKFTRLEAAEAQAFNLREAGADIIELGADSTRPASVCVGVETEWLRLEPVLKALTGKLPLALDTHHAEIVKRAQKYDLEFINDVSSAYEAEMFEAVKAARCNLCLMYSRFEVPHKFGRELEGDLVHGIKTFLARKITQASQYKFNSHKIILDPGMGAFISETPQRSFEVLNRFEEFEELSSKLMLGISRKGFLGKEKTMQQRDESSAALAQEVVSKLSSSTQLFLRVHNPRLHLNLRTAENGLK